MSSVALDKIREETDQQDADSSNSNFDDNDQ